MCAEKLTQPYCIRPVVFHPGPTCETISKRKRRGSYKGGSASTCRARRSMRRCARRQGVSHRVHSFRSVVSRRAVGSHQRSGRTVGSRAGAAVGDGAGRRAFAVPRDRGVRLRAASEPPHRLLPARRHRRAPHSRSQGYHNPASR